MPRKSKNSLKGGGEPNNVLTYEIKGAPGSNYIVFTLSENQSVLSSPGSLIYLKGAVSKGNLKSGSTMKAFARAFGGEDFFINSYTGLKGSGKVAFSTDIPGDIVKINIQPGQEYTISRASFLCGNDNIEISSRINANGFFGIGTDEGFILPTIKAIDKEASVWLSNYGTFEKITLPKGEEIIIDNGVFLAADSTMNYEILKLGTSFISSILGGEGFGMKFTGPGDIYIQSKNLNDLFSLISKYVHVTVNRQENKSDLVGNVIGLISDKNTKTCT